MVYVNIPSCDKYQISTHTNVLGDLRSALKDAEKAVVLDSKNPVRICTSPRDSSLLTKRQGQMFEGGFCMQILQHDWKIHLLAA